MIDENEFHLDALLQMGAILLFAPSANKKPDCHFTSHV